jgi:hypothetical protein
MAPNQEDVIKIWPIQAERLLAYGEKLCFLMITKIEHGLYRRYRCPHSKFAELLPVAVTVGEEVVFQYYSETIIE